MLLSQAAGKPVRLQWTRADMTVWGGKGPAVIMDVAGGFDATGAVTAVQFTSRAFSGNEFHWAATSAGNLLAGQLTGIANTTGTDEYVQWVPAYQFPNASSVAHILHPLWPTASPMRTMHLRLPQGPARTFASESFIDELAAAARVDPVEFRLSYLNDTRAKAVLTAATELAGWERRPSPKRLQGSAETVTGRGVALSPGAGTCLATVAEVEVNRRTGAIHVKRLACAHDCGLIVNPGILREMVAGNLIQSLGRALKEEVTFDGSKVTSVDWNSYQIARMSDIPEEVDIVLLNSDRPSSGAGEPSLAPTAAAIANAIFDATGARVRRAPFTPARIKEAIEKLQRA